MLPSPRWPVATGGIGRDPRRSDGQGRCCGGRGRPLEPDSNVAHLAVTLRRAGRARARIRHRRALRRAITATVGWRDRPRRTGSRRPDRDPAEPFAIPVHPLETDAGESRLWAPTPAGAAADDAGPAQRRTEPAGRRAATCVAGRPRAGRRASACACRPLTTRSTTPSASARSRPSMHRPTSIAWSWRPRPHTRTILGAVQLLCRRRRRAGAARRDRPRRADHGAARHRPSGSVPRRRP